MSRTSPTRAVAGLALATALALAAPIAPASAAGAAESVPTPAVSNPQTSAVSNGRELAAPEWDKIPTTAASHPFGGDAWLNRGIGLAKYSYVEEEFRVSGDANVYKSLPNTDYATEVINTSTYTTRALVRRPKDMRSWSGNVVVEYLNVTDNVDLQILWAKLAERVMTSGDVYVGFTGKGNVLEILREFDPERYGSLDMPNPVPADQQTCGLLPSEANYNPNTSKLFENGLLWDMWSQVGLTFKSSSSPLGKKASHVFAFGESQSGAALQNYFRWFGGNRTQVDGKPVYDGAFSETDFAPTGALNQCGGSLPAADPQRDAAAQPDRGIPYFSVHSQWDAWKTPPPASSFYRNWDITGSNHVDAEMYDHIYPIARDLLKSRAVGDDAFPWMQGLTPEMYSPSAWFCDNSVIPEVPFSAAQRKAYDWFKAWAIHGTQPPVLPYLERDTDGNLVVDADGNARGGLRLPEVTVPIATYLGGSWGDCGAFQVAFTEERKAELYSSPSDYVGKIRNAARSLVSAGLLSPVDAASSVARAGDRPIAGEDPAPLDVTTTFNVAGGNPLPAASRTKSVRVGETYGDLPVPTWDRHQFLGWFTAPAGGAQVTSSTMVTVMQGHTVYAQWRVLKRYGTVKPGSTVLRAKASTAARKVGTLKAGRTVQLLAFVDRPGTSNDWYRIDRSGKKAYVRAKHVKVSWK